MKAAFAVFDCTHIFFTARAHVLGFTHTCVENPCATVPLKSAIPRRRAFR